MATNILLITHGRIGEELLESARLTFNNALPTHCQCISIVLNCDPERMIDDAQPLIKTLTTSADLLILTDLFGATPSNIAHQLAQQHANVHVITGVNLPMLIRVLNYAGAPIDELVQKAISGGQDGILLAQPK